MYLSTLHEWLDWIGSVHRCDIELGLGRIKAVAARLEISNPTPVVITVGGTNGKGSTVAALEAIYLAAGYNIGVFTSPILFKHNEEVRINGQLPSDDQFCQAFAKIEAARGDISLTPFEFHTLAAILILQQQVLDAWILEVGLGGRLDAVNFIDANVAVITSIGIDHTEWLGETREAIAYEKAGIFREQRPAVCGDTDPPVSLLAHAKKLAVPLYCQGKNFSLQEESEDWHWQCGDINYQGLPKPSLYLPNMATALMVITLLQKRLPVKREAIDAAFKKVNLPGRLQIIPGEVNHILDVSHNPDAIQLLANKLITLEAKRKIAVFSMLADKDILTSINHIKNLIDDWYVAPLSTKRAASIEQLQKIFQQANITAHFFEDIVSAYYAAKQQAQAGDCLVVFGSFLTVAAVMVCCL